MLTHSNSLFVCVPCTAYFLFVAFSTGSIHLDNSEHCHRSCFMTSQRCFACTKMAGRNASLFNVWYGTKEEENPTFFTVGCEMTMVRRPNATNKNALRALYV